MKVRVKAVNPRPLRKRHLVIGLTLAVALVAGLILFVGVTRQVMTSLRETLLSNFRENTGYEISYDSISPSFFRFLEIRNLTIRSLDKEQRTVAAVETLRVHYRFFDLFIAPDKLRAIEKIEAERGIITADASKDAALGVFLENALKDPGSEFRFSPRFAFTGKNIDVSYTDNRLFWSLQDLFATVSSEGSVLSFSLHSRGEAGRLQVSGQPDYTTGLDMTGRVNRAFNILDAEFSVASFRAGDVILKDQRFLISLKNGVAEVTKVQDRSPLDLSLSYVFARNELSVDFLAANLRPGDILTFTDNLASLRPALSGSVTADGELRYLAEKNDLDFNLTLSARLPESVSTVAFGIDAVVTGTEERVDFSPVTLTSKLGNVEFNGNVVYNTFFPEGYLRFTNVKTSVTEDINADLSITRDGGGVTVTGDKVLIGSTGFRTFILDIFPRPRQAAFTMTAALDLPVRDHHLNVKGVLTYADEMALSLEGDLSMIPANIVYRAVITATEYTQTLDNMLSTIMLSSRFRLTTDFKTFSFSSPGMSLTDGTNSSNQVVFDFMADRNGLTLNQCRGVWADNRLEGYLALAQRKNDVLEINSAFSVNEERYELAGRSVPGSGLMVTGNHDLGLLLVPRPEGGHHLALQTSRLPVPVGGTTVYATLDWIGSISGKGDVELVSRRTLVTGLPALLPGMKNASAELQFSLHNEQVLVSRLRIRDAVSNLEGNGAFDVSIAPQTSVNGWLYLSDEYEFEHYQARLSLGSERDQIDVSFSNSPLSRLGESPVRGGLSGTVSVRGPLRDPVAEFNLSLDRGRFNAETVRLNTLFSLSREGLKIASLEGAYGKALTLEAGRGGYSLENGRLDFSARVITGNEKPVSSDIAFQAELSKPQAGAAPSSFFDNAFAGTLRVVNRPTADMKLENWDMRFAMANGEFTLAGGPYQAWRGMINHDGYFRFDIAPPFPLQGNFEGNVKNDMIDARAEGLVLLLPELNLLLNTPFFVIRDGVARGDLTVMGPIGDPDFYGLLSVERLAASSLAFADPIEPFDTLLEVNEKNIRFRDVRTRTGACPVDLQAEMTLDHWNVSRFIAKIIITDPVGAHLKLPVDVFSFDGFVSTPGLMLTVDPAGVAVAGELFLQNCDVVLGQSAKPPVDDQAVAANLIADLSLKTGKKVELYWPARELPILRMLSEPGAALGIKYNKLKNEFALNGDINFRGGNVYYFERSFLIREGSLSLKETQLDFNPLLNLKAERKVRYDDKDVKITLTVPNQRLKDFEPVFESDPPLPITERYLALGLPITERFPGPNSGQPDPENPQSNAYFTSIVSDIGGDVLTQILLLRPLEDKVKNLLDLDGFSIRTQLIKNLLLDTLFSTETTLPESTAISMGRYLNNTEISFQKYLDEKNKLFFETIVRFQADMLEGSPNTLNQSFGNVNVESEFSLELTTPFFLTIKWSITPEHWESFFLPDNRISFKWGISF